MQQTPISLIMVGTGSIARRYAKELTEIAGVQITATVTRTPDTSQQFVEEFPELCPRPVCNFTNIEEALEWGEFDAGYVCTWNDSHVPIGTQLIQANKYVFMEKPIALSLKDCLRLCQAVDSSSERLMMGGLGFRYYNRNLYKLKHYLQQPKLIVGRFITPRWPDDFWAMNEQQGGVFLSLGSHLMDMACFLAESEPQRISAAGGTYQHQNAMIDNLICQIEFQNGALASLAFGDCGEVAGLGEMTLEVFDGKRSARIEQFLPTEKEPIFTEREEYFEEGTQGNGQMPDFSHQPGTPSEEFIRWIRTNEQSILFPTLKDGVRAVALMEKAIQSARTGCWQSITLTELPLGFFS